MNSVKHLAKGSVLPTFTDNNLILYAMRFCPFAHRAHLVLNAKGIPYNMVPAMEIPNEATIHDSMVITDFLDEQYPEVKLHNPNPIKKALDRLVIDRFGQVIASLYKVFTSKTGLSTVSEELDKFLDSLDDFELELGLRKTEYFGGSKPGMVDYIIWPWMERSEMIFYIDNSQFKLNEDRFKNMIKWIAAMKNDAAVQLTKTSAEDHYKFFQTNNAGTPNYDMLVKE